MITIDTIDDRISKSEKPFIRTQINQSNSGTTSYDPVYVVLQSQYSELLEAAQMAHLLRSSKSSRPTNDQNRVARLQRSTLSTLAGHLARRTISLLGIG
jgi:hypothetical protein